MYFANYQMVDNPKMRVVKKYPVLDTIPDVVKADPTLVIFDEYGQLFLPEVISEVCGEIRE